MRFNFVLFFIFAINLCWSVPSFKRIKVKDFKEKEISTLLENSSTSKLKIINTYYDQNFFDIDVSQMNLEPSSSSKLKIVLKQKVWSKSTKRIILFTNSKEVESYIIDVSFSIASPLSLLSPKHAYIKASTLGGWQRTEFVWHERLSGVKYGGVKLSNPDFSKAHLIKKHGKVSLVVETKLSEQSTNLRSHISIPVLEPSEVPPLDFVVEYKQDHNEFLKDSDKLFLANKSKKRFYLDRLLEEEWSVVFAEVSKANKTIKFLETQKVIGLGDESDSWWTENNKIIIGNSNNSKILLTPEWDGEELKFIGESLYEKAVKFTLSSKTTEFRTEYFLYLLFVLVATGLYWSRNIQLPLIWHYSLIKNYLNVYPSTFLLTTIFTVYSLSTGNLFKFSTVLSFVFILSFSQLLSTLPCTAKLLIPLISVFCFLALLIVCSYHKATGTYLDFAILWSNLELLKYAQSWSVIFDSFQIYHAVIFVIAIVLLLFIEKKWGMFFAYHDGLKNRRSYIVTSLILANLSFSFLNVQSAPAKFFVITGYETLAGVSYKPNIADCPYLNVNELSYKFKDTPKPKYIFYLMMESFNEYFIDRYENGQEVTPFFNKLKSQGLYIDNFYGNSIQTAKGQFATLTGVLPSQYRKMFTSGNESLSVKALPDVLNGHAYQTVFLKAFNDLRFDNTGVFMKKFGFNTVESIGKRYKKKNDPSLYWNWGLEDGTFYKNSFDFFDTLGDEPKFVLLHTVSHHIPFDIPLEERKIYPDSNSSRFKNYVNSMHYADKKLQVFFEELKKRNLLDQSLIIVSGDHSYISSREEKRTDETYAYDEYFKTPLLFLGPAINDKSVDQSKVYSQLDMAPTILDILNIQEKNNFAGSSIFLDGKEEPVYLVQPYHGVSSAIVSQDKYKYVKNRLRNTEFLFDLNKDPEEKDNLLNHFTSKDKLEYFREVFKYFDKNEEIISQDKIYPSFKKDLPNVISCKLSPYLSKLHSFADLHQDKKLYTKQFIIPTVDFNYAPVLNHGTLGQFDAKTNFTLELDMKVEVKVAQSYIFNFLCDDGIIFEIDDELILLNNRIRYLSSYRKKVFLNKGMHNFKIRYFNGRLSSGLKGFYKVNGEKYLLGESSPHLRFF